MWQRASDLPQDLCLACWLDNIVAVDLEQGICIYTSRGNTRAKRTWIVERFNPQTCLRIPAWDKDRVKFRANDSVEAFARLSESRIRHRIETTFTAKSS